ncbi:hypothetical protein CAEBREN_04013 [Caenorhabditis brenneri]|uniref:Uncharacterized protein n=1 Tax=Caenorhabditis brenneri TaxID=135651 RepID=G0P4F9_CAEBE|nr:hypothetical protein CAEBREN_04013 [Caenorhabditis brenneri]
MPDNLLPPDPAPNPALVDSQAQFLQQLLLNSLSSIPMQYGQFSKQNNLDSAWMMSISSILSMLPSLGSPIPTLPVNKLPDSKVPTPQKQLAMKDQTIAQQVDLINIQQEEIKFLKARQQRLKSKQPSPTEEDFWKQQVHFMNREAYHNRIREGWRGERDRLVNKVSLLDEEVSKLKLENETLKVKENPHHQKTIEESLQRQVIRLKETVEILKKQVKTPFRRNPLLCNTLSFLSNPGKVDQIIQQALARRATLTPHELFVEKVKLEQFVKNIGKYYEAVSQPPVITIDDDVEEVEGDGPTPRKRRCEN